MFFLKKMRETHNDNHIKCAEDGGKKKGKGKKRKEKGEKKREKRKERAVVGCSG